MHPPGRRKPSPEQVASDSTRRRTWCRQAAAPGIARCPHTALTPQNRRRHEQPLYSWILHRPSLPAPLDGASAGACAPIAGRRRPLASYFAGQPPRRRWFWYCDAAVIVVDGLDGLAASAHMAANGVIALTLYSCSNAGRDGRVRCCRSAHPCLGRALANSASRPGKPCTRGFSLVRWRTNGDSGCGAIPPASPLRAWCWEHTQRRTRGTPSDVDGGVFVMAGDRGRCSVEGPGASCSARLPSRRFGADHLGPGDAGKVLAGPIAVVGHLGL